MSRAVVRRPLQPGETNDSRTEEVGMHPIGGGGMSGTTPAGVASLCRTYRREAHPRIARRIRARFRRHVREVRQRQRRAEAAQWAALGRAPP